MIVSVASLAVVWFDSDKATVPSAGLITFTNGITVFGRVALFHPAYGFVVMYGVAGPAPPLPLTYQVNAAPRDVLICQRWRGAAVPVEPPEPDEYAAPCRHSMTEPRE